MRLFSWTDSDRLAATGCVSDAVLGVNGFVLDSRRFSNKALVLQVEMPAYRALEFAEAIGCCGVKLDDDSQAALARVARTMVGAKEQLVSTLHIRFMSDEPDLRIETPHVPG